MRRIRLTAVLMLAAAPLAHAGQENAGTTAANFLSVGQGASALSMAGASLASSAGLDAAAWNPAALAGLGASQFTLSHASLAAGTSQEYAAFGGRFGETRTRWSMSALYQSEGGFEGRDAFNQPTGSFQVSDMAVGLQVARPLGERVHAGLGLKWVREALGDASGSGIAFDAGVQARSGSFGFGFAARNVGGSVAFDGASYDMPGVVGAGVSYAHAASGLRLAVDANLPSAYYNDVRAGAEWRWRDRVALRSGYRANLGAPAGEGLSGATFGLGLGANGFWFDYAFLAGEAEAQGRHRFGMTFQPSALASLGGRGLMGADAASPPATADRAPVAARSPEPAPTAKPSVSERSAAAASARTSPTAVAAPSAPDAGELAARLDESALAQAARLAASPPATADRARPAAPALEPSRSVRVPRLSTPRLDPPAASAPLAAAAPVITTPAPPTVRVRAVPAPPAAPSRTQAAPEASGDAASHGGAPAAAAQPVSSRAPEVHVVPRSPSTPRGPRPTAVEVQTGETLASLAKRWDTSVPRLMMENNLVTEHVKPGRKLKLPPAGSR